MSRLIRLSDELYERLERAAEVDNITPVDWLDRHIPKLADLPEPKPGALYERMKDHIGKFSIDWDNLKEDPNDPFFNYLLQKKREGRL